MYYVGIDVSAKNHHCYIANKEDFENGLSFEFDNNSSGFGYFISQLPNIEKDEIVIGLEATGHYSTNIFIFLNNSGYNVIKINPLQSKKFAEGLSLRSLKTDKSDAKDIARLCLLAHLNPHLSRSYHESELKSLTRHRSRLIEKRKRILQQINRLVYLTFPELLDNVSSLDTNFVLNMLYEYPSAEDIAKAHLTKLGNILKKASRGRYGKDKAKEFKSLAKKSIGNASYVNKLEMVQYISLLRLVKEKIKEVDGLIKEEMIESKNVLLSIPGVSFTLGAIIQAEIGDISRFDNPGQVLAYAGLDPKIKQSGMSNSTEVKMNKKGSSYLRNALIQAARLIKDNDKTFHDYYEKKREEGKKYYVALSHVARKLVRVIFKLLSENIKFSPQS